MLDQETIYENFRDNIIGSGNETDTNYVKSLCALKKVRMSAIVKFVKRERQGSKILRFTGTSL